MRRIFLTTLSFAVASAVLCASGVTTAQNAYPNKPIRLVVPFAAGGGNDSVARVLGDAMAKVLGQTVVVDNRAGAGGNIGTDLVAKSAPDGYTLLHVANTVVVNPSLYRQLPYDIEKDLEPLGLVAASPLLLAANPASGITSLAGLVDGMKAPGTKLAYATPGVGTPHHFAMALLSSELKSGILHVAYKGAGAAATDVLGGQVPILVSTPQSVNDFIASGRLRLLATMEPKRTAQFKDTPVVAEAVPGFSVSIWHGLMAPAGVPKPIVDKLSATLQKVLNEPEVQSRLQSIGFQAGYQPPDAMAKRIREEVPTWKKVAQSAGITPE